MGKKFSECDFKLTKVDLSGFQNRAVSRVERIARGRQSTPQTIYAVVTGSGEVEHKISFESVAKLSEALGRMMGLQISVHRPQNNEFLH